MRADAAEGVEIVLGDAQLVAPIVQAAKLEDAIEPMSAVDLDTMDAWSNRDAFLARIASKHPVTAAGAPPARTYVRVDDDGSLVTWSPAREADVVRGLRDRRDVVMTTGPFLRVTANGAPIGGVARATADKDFEVKVHVECAPWIAADRVSIVRASGQPVESRPDRPPRDLHRRSRRRRHVPPPRRDRRRVRRRRDASAPPPTIPPRHAR